MHVALRSCGEIFAIGLAEGVYARIAVLFADLTIRAAMATIKAGSVVRHGTHSGEKRPHKRRGPDDPSGPERY